MAWCTASGETSLIHGIDLDLDPEPRGTLWSNTYFDQPGNGANELNEKVSTLYLAEYVSLFQQKARCSW